MRDNLLDWLREHDYSAALLPGEGADENVEDQLRAGTLPAKMLIGLDGKNELSPQFSQVGFFSFHRNSSSSFACTTTGFSDDPAFYISYVLFSGCFLHHVT